MTSQAKEFPQNQKLKVKMHKLQKPGKNGISVSLDGTYGFSRNPVIQQGINITTQSRSDTIGVADANCTSDADEMECSFCVPGGQNVTHRVILTGVYQADDDFYIHEIKLGDKDCIFTHENITSGK